VLMADTALKSANVEVVAYSSPAHGTSFSNEAILVISGDSGAVSIARRLQDPLAELVKIDPKSIGVGQYQHDVSQTQLARKL
ncbi:BMC domain-containing protein, partial [Salmonella enterica subsp. enterica serovar Anatum]|nr:BMC domain-containing protein [Salmonella enterica subsp. enterica serovar Anatum]